MKNKCLQFIFGVSLFFCLAFLSVREVKAADVAFYEQLSSGVLIGGISTPQGYGLKFTATNNSLSLVKIALAGYNSSLNTVYLKICEIPSLTTADTSANTDCLDTPFLLATVVSYLPSNGSSQYTDFVIETPYYTEPGHFYKLKVTNSANNILGDTVAGSHTSGFATFQWNAGNLYNYYTTGYKLKTQLYYDDTLESWCGDTVCNGTETCGTCESDCGVCPIDNPYLDQSIFFFNNPYTCIINSTCNIHYAYNTDLISDYDYIEIFQWSEGFGTSTSIGTTTIEESTGFLQDKANGQSHFFLTSDATTTKTIYYDVITHLAAYYDYNTGLDIAATTTIPYVVSVIWSGQPDVNTIITGINDLAANDLASTTILGINAHSMACSEDQWSASSSIGILGEGTSVGFLTCVLKESGIDFGLKIVSVVKTIIDGAIRILSYTFPLNIPIKIQNSWTAAQHTALPSNLSWLAIGDVYGNITLDIPALYAGAATTTWTVWGPNLWGNTGAINTMLAHWKALTVYLLWAIWILLGIYELANKIIKKHE